MKTKKRINDTDDYTIDDDKNIYITALLHIAVLFGYVLLMSGGLFVAWVIGG